MNVKTLKKLVSISFLLATLVLLTTISQPLAGAEPWHDEEMSYSEDYGWTPIIIELEPVIPWEPDPVFIIPPIPFQLITEFDYMLFDHHGGWWYDVEKTSDNTDDDLMCWAAAASNALEWTGWGVTSTFTDTDDMFDHFLDHWVDRGGFMVYGWEWWFDGTDPGDSRIDVSGGGNFWSPESAATYYHEEWDQDEIMERIDEYLHDGIMTTIGIRPVGGSGGHAITVWGYRYDSAEDDYYTGIWVTDSDDNKGSSSTDPPPNTLRLYDLEWDDTNDRWEMSNYGGGWYIEAIMALEPRAGDRPDADAGGSYTGYEGSPVTFSGASSSDGDGDGDSLEYRWDFDEDDFWDTGWASSDTASNTWNDDYTGTVLLEVFDGVFKDVDEFTVTVLNVAPSVNAGGDQTVDEGDTVSFSGSFTDPGADTHTIEWDFGDGSPVVSGSLNPIHVYADNGVYSVMLTVTDDDGGVGQDTMVVTVNNVSPSVDAGPDQTMNEGDAASLSGDFTDPGYDTHTIEWDFGDGSPVVSGTLSPTHVYVDDGVYTATLTVTDDDGGVGVDTLTITVYNVAPSVDAGIDQTADEGDTVVFSGSFTDPGIADTHTYSWDFGDGQTTSDTLTPTHEYGDNGVYTVTLTVTDDDGGVGVDTLTVTVANVAPTVTLTSDQPNPQFVLPSVHEITFVAGFTDPGWLDTHMVSWDFGDGTVGPGTVAEENDAPDSTGSSTASHTYSSTGTYTVTVTFIDDDGGSGSDTYVVRVVTAEEAVQDLDDYIQGLPDEAFKNNPDQRKNALGSMLSEVIEKIMYEDPTGAINKLNSIRDKADGVGPDWITDPEAQSHVLMKIDDIVAYLALL